MEGLLLLVVGFVVAIPVIAIVALVRTSRLRDLFDERQADLESKIRFLESTVANLQRELKSTPVAASSRVQSTVAQEPVQPDPARVWAPPEHLRPQAEPPSEPIPIPVATVIPAAETTPAAPEAVEVVPQLIESVAGADLETHPCESPILPQESVTPLPIQPAPEPALEPLFASTAASSTVHFSAQPPRRTIGEQIRAVLPLEEVLGMNLFAKIGIVLLVLGFALLGRVALVSMGPGARVAMIYAAAGVMLGGGVWLERKERYRLLGRTGIGGGWALLFFTTYAMHHVAAMAVLASNTLDCVLMLLVAAAMVAHTLRYQSQLVTGLAFLLAFSTVALSQDSVYSLVAGVVLAIGIAGITLRMSWYELEIFGILASFTNHFYWLYKLYPEGVAGHPFPQFWPSAIILVLYWAIFRTSYVARSIRTAHDEMLSSVAALLNPTLLLAVMKFQATHPALAFYALLGLGSLEFSLGELPVMRRRRPAFILLTVLGSILIFAAVPFKFTGNNIALLWMIVAEVLLVAGFVQREVVFRRLGWLGGIITGAVILYEAQGIAALRRSSDAPLVESGVLLLSCAVLFYLNALFLRWKWSELFDRFDAPLSILQSYLGAVTGVLGVWALLAGEWEALGWAVLMMAGAVGRRALRNKHLLIQSWSMAVLVLVQAGTWNLHLEHPYPEHILARLIIIPLLAGSFYGMAWVLSGLQDATFPLRTPPLWAGSVLLACLAWVDVNPLWIAPVWVALGVVVSLIGRRISVRDFHYQEHLLVIASAIQLLAINLGAPQTLERYVPLLVCAGALYAISRFCTAKDASYLKPAAWAHTWAATLLLSTLAWHESPQPWVAPIWAAFALSLAVVDRIFDVEELPYQAHLLALLSVIWAVTVDMFTEGQWHKVGLRLLTVSILIAILYTMARLVRLPSSLHDTEARHVYTWTASGLVAWLLWHELEPVGVALGLAVFGLLLFEVSEWRHIKHLRWQAFVALMAAFGRIFFVNLTATALPGEFIGPRVYTVAPIALIYFFVWARLQTGNEPGSRWSVRDLIAYCGTISIVALLYFEVPAEWIILSWSIVVALLMFASLLLKREVFLHQAELVIAAIVTRGIAHNIFGGSYFVEGGWRGSLVILPLSCGVLLASLPIAFQLRARCGALSEPPRLVRLLALRRPEHFVFFAPVVLISFMIAVKMNPGMVTLAWGIEGLMVILLGLTTSQRSYRLTGLLLLLLCVGKIVFHDAWLLGETDRYITFIVLGGSLFLVSALYGRYRETVRKLL